MLAVLITTAANSQRYIPATYNEPITTSSRSVTWSWTYTCPCHANTANPLPAICVSPLLPVHFQQQRYTTCPLLFLPASNVVGTVFCPLKFFEEMLFN